MGSTSSIDDPATEHGAGRVQSISPVEHRVANGRRQLQQIFAGEPQDPSDVSVRDIVWALMDRAESKGQAFGAGVFVIYGEEDGIKRLMKTLLQYAQERKSSHFPNSAVAANKILGGEAGGKHFGIDTKGLPRGNKHVLFGFVRFEDRSLGMYIKPEKEGVNLKHAYLYVESKTIRKAGSKASRQRHDEGDDKRKEHVLCDDEDSFQALIDQLDAMKASLAQQQGAPLHKLYRSLQEVEEAAARFQDEVKLLRQSWDEQYGDGVPFRFGNEVQISTHDFRITEPTGQSFEATVEAFEQLCIL